MKKLFIMYFLFMFGTYIYSQSLTYIDINSYKNDGIIQITDIKDFLNIIDNNNIKNIYRYKWKGYFLIVTDNAWFSFDGKKYKYLDDYISGINLGFKEAKDFYFCRDNKIRDFENYSMMNNFMFLSQEDLDDAKNKGFLDFLATKIINKFSDDSKSKEISYSFQELSMNPEYRNKYGYVISDLLLPIEIDKISFENSIGKIEKWIDLKHSHIAYEGGPRHYNPKLENILEYLNSNKTIQNPKYKLVENKYILRKNMDKIKISGFNLGALYYFMKAEGFTNLNEYLTYQQKKGEGK